MAKSYWEKLQDPRWQRKRLKIMERDKFACRECGGTELALNVHHSYYEKGAEPWEHPDSSLHTLCEECHPRRASTQLIFQRLAGCLEDIDWLILIGAVLQRLPQYGKGETFDFSALPPPERGQIAWGLARMMGIDPIDVRQRIDENVGRISMDDIHAFCSSATAEVAHVAH